jgi:hypothetical protein
MASLLAVQLRHKLEAYLGRELTVRQVKKVEEIILNFKPWYPTRFLEALEETLSHESTRQRNWGLFYFPLYAVAKAFRGYTRRSNMVYLRGRLRRVYDQCDALGGDGYGEKDLSAILFLAGECTDKEIHHTFTIARTYGLRTIRHLRGIILKNRALAIQPRLTDLGFGENAKVKEQVTLWANSKYPVVKSLQDLYYHRIFTLQDREKPVRFRFDWDELNESEEVTDGPIHDTETTA